MRGAGHPSSAEIERLLRTGEQAELLASYFGDAEYRGLCQLARKVARNATPSGQRVLLIPGFLGSTLGIRGGRFGDAIWFNPLAILDGELLRLAQGTAADAVEALDVIPLLYTRLKLQLQASGFNVAYHHYDWRRSLEFLGRQLAMRLAAEPADGVSLVAHGTGGLVARMALAAGAPGVKQAILLGTPNHGTFAAVQLLRGIHQTARQLAALDLRHEIGQLTRDVFQSFPSLYQLLPAPSQFNEFDLYQADNWPLGSGIRQELLDDALRLRAALRGEAERLTVVAGFGQPTVIGLQREDDGCFLYLEGGQGDGAVPLRLAELKGAPVRHVRESHNGLLRNERVAAAVCDLLRGGRGELDVLPAEESRASVRRLSDHELEQIRPFEGREGTAITERERRSIITTLFSAAPPGKARELEDSLESAEMDSSVPLDGVVVGRRRRHRVDVELILGNITDIDARACVLGAYQNVTPTGPAREFDELLGGAISELISRRMFSARAGEVFILPTGRRGVRVDHLLLAGLGPYDRFNSRLQKLVASNVVRTLLHAGIDELAAVLLGASGQESDVSLKNLVEGFIEGLLDADTRFRFRRIALCSRNPQSFLAMRRQLYLMASGPLFDRVEVTISEHRFPPRARPAAEATGLPLPGERATYLTVRQERDAEGNALVRSSALTAGGKATVLSGVKTLDPDALAATLRQLETRPLDVAAFGERIARLLLPGDLITLLDSAALRDHHLVVVHDGPMSRVPWETLAIGGAFPALNRGLSRRYLAENMAVAKWLERRRLGPRLDLLLVVNPTSDLPGAEREGQILRAALEGFPQATITERRGADASRDRLLDDLQSGAFDVLHYAGHAFFDPTEAGHGGIICAGQQVLRGSDLAALGNLPALAFFNACESGRVRNAAGARNENSLEASVGLAEAFLRGGIGSFVGTYWPVDDRVAVEFAARFYGTLLQNGNMGVAVIEGRRAVERTASPDWADYLHYGDPSFQLKITDTQSRE